jgi:cytochrome P450
MRDMLLSMDPPRHIAYRKPLAPEFAQRVIAGMADQIRTITSEIFDRCADNEDVEFVHEVVGPLPTQVIGRLFG